jgi:hypothetical protein
LAGFAGASVVWKQNAIQTTLIGEFLQMKTLLCFCRRETLDKKYFTRLQAIKTG